MTTTPDNPTNPMAEAVGARIVEATHRLAAAVADAFDALGASRAGTDQAPADAGPHEVTELDRQLASARLTVGAQREQLVRMRQASADVRKQVARINMRNTDLQAQVGVLRQGLAQAEGDSAAHVESLKWKDEAIERLEKLADHRAARQAEQAHRIVELQDTVTQQRGLLAAAVEAALPSAHDRHVMDGSLVLYVVEATTTDSEDFDQRIEVPSFFMSARSHATAVERGMAFLRGAIEPWASTAPHVGASACPVAVLGPPVESTLVVSDDLPDGARIVDADASWAGEGICSDDECPNDSCLCVRTGAADEDDERTGDELLVVAQAHSLGWKPGDKATCSTCDIDVTLDDTGWCDPAGSYGDDDEPPTYKGHVHKVTVKAPVAWPAGERMAEAVAAGQISYEAAAADRGEVLCNDLDCPNDACTYMPSSSVSCTIAAEAAEGARYYAERLGWSPVPMAEVEARRAAADERTRASEAAALLVPRYVWVTIFKPADGPGERGLAWHDDLAGAAAWLAEGNDWMTYTVLNVAVPCDRPDDALEEYLTARWLPDLDSVIE